MSDCSLYSTSLSVLAPPSCDVAIIDVTVRGRHCRHRVLTPAADQWPSTSAQTCGFAPDVRDATDLVCQCTVGTMRLS